MGAVPHVSEEWLAAYNARLAKARVKMVEAAKAAEGRPVACAGATDVGSSAYSAKAVEVPIRGYDGKQTRTEMRYNRDVLGGAGRFEAVCLYLPGGGRYTPDFMTLDDGEVTFHEVKGSYRLQSQGRAHTAFHEAAAAFPMWRFVWAVERKGGGFDVRRFNSADICGGTH